MPVYNVKLYCPLTVTSYTVQNTIVDFHVYVTTKLCRIIFTRRQTRLYAMAIVTKVVTYTKPYRSGY